MSIALTVLLEPDRNDGGWVASVMAIPGVYGQGETREEAEESLQDALELRSQEPDAVGQFLRSIANH